MATCKDCLSYDICSYHAATKAMHGLIEEKLVYIANQIPCKFFKPNSHYVEIPCYCKECEYFNNYNSDRTYCEEHSDGWGDNRVYVDEDDYCSFGIRKKEGADNG